MTSAAVLALMAFATLPGDALLLQGRADLDDPKLATDGGHMFDMSRSQPWVLKLLNDPQAGQEAAAKHVPAELALIKAARASPADRAATLAACRAINSKGSQDHANKPYLAAAGGINMIIASLRHFSDDQEVLLICSGALGVGTILYQFDLQEYAGRLGGVELVLDAQRRFKDDPAMQMGGISGCFHDFSYANRERFQKAGGMEYLIETIDRHFDNPNVVLQCWYAFSSGTQAPNERRFVAAGGIPRALRSMTVHANFSRVREEVMQSLRAVEGCHGCGDLQANLVQAGIIPALLTAAREVPMDVHTQSPVCANLLLLTAGNASQRRMAIDQGAVSLALQAVKRFPDMISSVNWNFDDQYTVYDDCLGALAHMAQDDKAAAQLRGLGAQGVVLTAMENKPNSFPVKRAGDAILKKLGQ